MVTENLRETIKRYLPDAKDIQVEHFAVQVERLKKLEVFFKDFASEEERKEFKEKLELAQKLLQYEKPYRIAMIGRTGAGKSTLINALLGRDLVLTRDVGQPATGAALEIFLDVREGGIEKADVSYRDQSNIYALVKDFVQRYQLGELELPGNLNINFSTVISQLEPQIPLFEGERSQFEELRKRLADIVIQFVNNQNNLRKEFLLAKEEDCTALMALIDEHSRMNQSSEERRIGLVKSVSYHIIMPSQSPEARTTTLQLPNNVCLVDLPGIDGTALHDIIIKEGIKDADAIVFILGAKRILVQNETYLLNRVRQYVSLENSTQSGDRIFLVVNNIDSIMVDQKDKLDELPTSMQQLMDRLMPDYSKYFSNRGGKYPYFLTSAWMAYAVQKKIKTGTIEDPTTYEATKLKLGVKDKNDREILEASQIPKLVEELTKFARDYRIEGQIRDGKLALDIIINKLIEKFQNNIKNINLREKSPIEKEREILKERQKQQEKLIQTIRKDRDQKITNIQTKLQEVAKSICNETDMAILKKMPELWKKAFDDRDDRLTHKNITKPIYEYILTETQIYLWHILNDKLPEIAKELIQDYTNIVQQYKIAEELSNGCYGYVEVSTIKSIIQQQIDSNIDFNLKTIASRIAMLSMTDPGQYFTQNLNNQPKNKELFDILAKVPREQELKSDDFIPFVTEIRKLYESFVYQICINGLLNLYRYEMIVIEDFLLKYIRETFGQITSCYSNEPFLKAKINESLNIDPDWELLNLLKEKLVLLKTIKS